MCYVKKTKVLTLFLEKAQANMSNIDTLPFCGIIHYSCVLSDNLPANRLLVLLTCLQVRLHIPRQILYFFQSELTSVDQKNSGISSFAASGSLLPLIPP